MYEPEEALVPLWAPDLGPEVVVVDPELTRTVGAAQAGAMGVAALSGCFDAMLCASERAVLGLGVEGRVLQAADRLARGLEALGAAAPARQAAAR
jgi:alcohol dehydrogenase class IV